MKRHKQFISWITFVSLAVLGVVYAETFGFLSMIIEGDSTGLVYCILAITVAATIQIGIYNIGNSPVRGWVGYTTDLTVALGLLGTFIGFGIILNTNLSVSLDNVGEINKILSNMSSGMGTALYTSIVGLICSLFIRLQLELRELFV